MPPNANGLAGGLQSVALNMFSNAGFMTGQFSPITSMHDQAMANQAGAEQWRAMQQAGTLDRPQLQRIVEGSLRLSGSPSSAQQQDMSRRVARLMELITTNTANLSPEIIDQIGGRQGLAANLARGVTEGLRNTRYGAGNAGQFTAELHRELYGTDNRPILRDMNGVSANRAGQLFNELSRRGLLTMANDRQQVQMVLGQPAMDGATSGPTVADRMAVGGPGSSLQDIVSGSRRLQDMLRGVDVRLTADTLQQWSGAVAAARDLLQANGRPDASVTEMFTLMEDLTQGGSNGMNPGNIQMLIRRAHQMSRNTPGGLQRYLTLVRQGGQMAEAAGVSRTIGGQTAAMSMAFGQAFGQRAGQQGVGGLSRDEASALDQQLRTAAMASPMANSLGAIMSLHADGQIRNGPAMQIVEAITSRNTQAMAQMANMTQRQVTQMLQQSGVDPRLAAQYLSAHEANQVFVERYSIQDLVRQMQGHGEIANLMRTGLQGGMTTVLRDVGFNQGEIVDIRGRASTAAQQALMGMSGEDLSSTVPEVRVRRNQIVADAIMRAVGPAVSTRIGHERLETMAAAAIRSLEASMSRNPGLRRFRNLAGLVGMNSGEVFSTTNQTVNRADAEARTADLTAGLGQMPVLARIAEAIAGAGNDTQIGDIIALTLGAEPQSNVVTALTPVFALIRAGRADRAANRDTEAARNLRANIDSAVGLASQFQLRDVERAATPAGRAGGQAPPATGSELSLPGGFQLPSQIGAAIDNKKALGAAVGIGGRLSSPPAFASDGPAGRKISELSRRDREVRLQEELHHRAAGEHAIGSPRYVWQTGPDGKPYAIGGHVMVDMSPVRGDPAATAAKMAQLQRAATIPGAAGGAAGVTSADDAAVSHRASQMEQQALMQMSSPPSSQPASPDFETPRATTAPDVPWLKTDSGGGKMTGPMKIEGTLRILDDGTAEFNAFQNTVGAPPSVSSF